MAIGHQIRVNPIRCQGFGYCAELFPERIALDDWGYPILDEKPFGAELLGHAQRAVASCPRLALELHQVEMARARPRTKGVRGQRR